MDKWYVKNTQGKTFGPIGLDDLRQWVREGRVEPLAGISSDLKNWMLAPLKPELEMDWVVENNPGQFYGPTHRAVIDDLVASGSLSPDARFYQDDRGASAAQAASAAQQMAEANDALAAANEQLAAAKKEAAKLKAACDEAVARADAAIAELDAVRKSAAESGKAQEAAEGRASKLESELESCRAEIAKLKERIEKLDEVHAREWKVADEVIEPEIVSDAPPPSVARAAFTQQGAANGASPLKASFAGAKGNAAAMAALEAQARRELARMGASGAKKFFRFK